jgi:hypothetical protein
VKKNIGSIDRTVRTIMAPVLVVVGVLVGPGGWLAIVLYALAAILLATAVRVEHPSGARRRTLASLS